MPNTEILEGLKYAISKGEPLEKAMTSFYNAGYRKEEIEEAARFIQQEGIPISVAQETRLIPEKSSPQSKISSYGQENKKPNPVKKAGKGIVIAIIVAAIIFVGLLIAFLITT